MFCKYNEIENRWLGKFKDEESNIDEGVRGVASSYAVVVLQLATRRIILTLWIPTL